VDSTQNGRVKARDGVMFREIAGESVLLNLDSETYFGLDDVGTTMWNVLVAAPSIEGAFAVLAGEFEVEPDTLRADLCAFVERLAEAGLIAIEDA
jgi:hypothetical protein